jgi:hypothetical protein
MLALRVGVGAEMYAAAVRIILWAQGQLTELQQDMCIKNLLFTMSVYGAYSMWMSVKVWFLYSVC